MPKYVFDNPDLHYLTRGAVLLVIAPYMMWAAAKHGDRVLATLAVTLFAFDTWSITNETSASSKTRIHQNARLAALLVQAPYMIWAGWKYGDDKLMALGVLTAAADAYTYYLGEARARGK